MRSTIGTVAVIAAAGLTICTGGCAPDTSDHLRTTPLMKHVRIDTGMSLKIGDKIKIVMHNPDIQQFDAVIDADGSITLPFIGQVRIAGLSSADAERNIRMEYIRQKIFKEGAIQVAIVPPSSEFYVEGQVNRPGPYQFTRGITVLQAVGMAGGPNEFADRRKRTLIRGAITIDVDVEKVRRGEQIDPPVQPGDRIVVSRGWY